MSAFDDELTKEWVHTEVCDLDTDGRLRSILLQVRKTLSDACGEAEWLRIEEHAPLWWDRLRDARETIGELLESWERNDA